MFKSKRVILFITLLVAATMINMIIGCDRNTVSESEFKNNSDLLFTKTSNQITPNSDSQSLLYNDNRIIFDDLKLDKSIDELTLDFHYITLMSKETKFRKLKIKKDKHNTDTFIACIMDSQNKEMVSLSISLINDSTINITESTALDYLSITTEIKNKNVVQTYDFNKNFYSISFTEDELDSFEKWYIKLNENEIKDLDKSPNSYQKFLKFNEFYKFNSSLDNNIEGELLSYIITSNEFNNLIEQKYQINLLKINSGEKLSADDMCTVAALTGRVKCFFGGAANFVCVAAAGVGAACLIWKTYELFT